MPTFREDTHRGSKTPLINGNDIDNLSITTEKIADGAVTKDKLGYDIGAWFDNEEEARSEGDKAIVDSIRDANSIVNQTETGIAIKPNVLNVWAAPISNLNISFIAGEKGQQEEYKMRFKTGESPISITMPADIKWPDGEMDWDPNTQYEISVLNGLAVVAAWEE